MESRAKIYISGPITGIEEYMDNFVQAEKEMLAEGYAVINPAKVLMHLPLETGYTQYMKLSLLMLEDADEIYMLRGWQHSKGARLEYEYAVATGKPIRQQN